MHFSNAAAFGLTALTSYAAAQGGGIAFTTVPNDCQVGQSCTIEWEGAGGAVCEPLYICAIVVLGWVYASDSDVRTWADLRPTIDYKYFGSALTRVLAS